MSTRGARALSDWELEELAQARLNRDGLNRRYAGGTTAVVLAERYQVSERTIRRYRRRLGLVERVS